MAQGNELKARAAELTGTLQQQDVIAGAREPSGAKDLKTVGSALTSC